MELDAAVAVLWPARTILNVGPNHIPRGLDST